MTASYCSIETLRSRIHSALADEIPERQSMIGCISPRCGYTPVGPQIGCQSGARVRDDWANPKRLIDRGAHRILYELCVQDCDRAIVNIQKQEMEKYATPSPNTKKKRHMVSFSINSCIMSFFLVLL